MEKDNVEPKHNNTHGKSYYTMAFKKLRLWQKIMIFALLAIVIFLAQAYAIAFWYQKKHASEPLQFGVTFIADYARHLDLDPQETMLALRDDLGFKRFRLVSYWNNIEKQPGVYDFSELDQQFKNVNEVNGEVNLAIGLRQPRWPECHAPSWVNPAKKDEWYPQLKNYMDAVIERYKDNPALKSYHLENEYYLSVFGDCAKFGAERERLIDEYNFVKSKDSNTPIILSYSNNYIGVATGKPQPDQIGVSVYKKVWNTNIIKFYFNYPYPSWYYAWRAGLQQILTGKSSMLHELQAEPWPPTQLKETSLAEQDKSMNAKILAERFDFGADTGFRDIDLWGGEWWYWRKVHFNDDSLWQTAKHKMSEYKNPNM